MLNLRHSVWDNFHHFELNQLFEVEFTRAPGCRLKTAQSGRQVGVSFRWSSGRVPILHALFLQRQPSGKRQPITTQIRNCGSTKSALDLNIGSGDLTEANEVAALIGHRAYAAWKNSACSVGSRRRCAAELAAFERHRQRCSSCKHPSSAAFCADFCSPLPPRPRVNPLLGYNTMSQPGYWKWTQLTYFYAKKSMV